MYGPLQLQRLQLQQTPCVFAKMPIMRAITDKGGKWDRQDTTSAGEEKGWGVRNSFLSAGGRVLRCGKRASERLFGGRRQGILAVDKPGRGRECRPFICASRGFFPRGLDLASELGKGSVHHFTT